MFAGSLTNTPALAGVIEHIKAVGGLEAALSEPVVAYSLTYPDWRAGDDPGGVSDPAVLEEWIMPAEASAAARIQQFQRAHPQPDGVRHPCQ